MQRIAIQDAKDGMILAEPAVDAQGRILMAKGEKLTLKLIERFTNYGVHEVVVEGDLSGGDEVVRVDDPVLRSQLDDIRRRTSVAFQDHADHPVMQRIKNLAEKNLLYFKHGK